MRQQRLERVHLGRDVFDRLHDDEVTHERQLALDLEELLEEAHVLDDRCLRLAVAREVRDLLDGGGVVDRDRYDSEELRGHVERVELGPVAHHQHDLVAGDEAEAAHARGGTGRVVRVLAERPLVPSAVGVHGSERDQVLVRGDGAEELTRDGLPRDRLVDLFDARPVHGRVPLVAVPHRLAHGELDSPRPAGRLG